MSTLIYGSPIGLAQARRVVAACETEARVHGWAMVFVVLDSGGHLVLLERMDDAQYGSIDVAQAKAQTAVRYRRSTRSYEERLIQGGLQWRMLTMPGVCAVEGGVPLVVDGKLIGALGVSGASSAEDGQVAAAGVRALAS